MTASASAGCSSARISPIRSRVAYTETPPSRLEAEARYTCSKMQSPRRSRDARSAIVDAQHLARRNVAHEGGADRVERARLARDQPRAALAPQAERPHAERIADRIERARREEDERPRAHER